MKAAVLTEFGEPLETTNSWWDPDCGLADAAVRVEAPIEVAVDVLESMSSFKTVGVAIIGKH